MNPGNTLGQSQSSLFFHLGGCQEKDHSLTLSHAYHHSKVSDNHTCKMYQKIAKVTTKNRQNRQMIDLQVSSQVLDKIPSFGYFGHFWWLFWVLYRYVGLGYFCLLCIHVLCEKPFYTKPSARKLSRKKSLKYSQEGGEGMSRKAWKLH